MWISPLHVHASKFCKNSGIGFSSIAGVWEDKAVREGEDKVAWEGKTALEGKANWGGKATREVE